MRSAIVGLVASFAASALAADHPCQQDAERLCKGVEPGQGRIVKCLQQHEADLSDACRNEGRKISEERGAHRAMVQDVRQSCRDDAQKLCSEVKPGGGRIARCLRSHKSELSQACTAAVEQAKDRW